MEAERVALVREELPARSPPGVLMRLRGIGPEFAAVLWLEGFFRHFANQIFDLLRLVPVTNQDRVRSAHHDQVVDAEERDP